MCIRPLKLLGTIAIALLASCGGDDSSVAGGGTDLPAPQANVPTLDTNSYGSPWTKDVALGTLTDARDGKIYQTVTIGDSVWSLTWMARNLDYKGSGADTIGRCYANSPDSCAKYGRLYTWTEAMKIQATYASTTGGVNPGRQQGICPTGWHVSDGNDWNYIGNKADTSGDFSASNLLALQAWPNARATDALGFRAMPGGYRDTTGEFLGAGQVAQWWSKSEESAHIAWTMYFSSTGNTYNGLMGKTGSASVRCVQDRN